MPIGQFDKHMVFVVLTHHGLSRQGQGLKGIAADAHGRQHLGFEVPLPIVDLGANRHRAGFGGHGVAHKNDLA